MVKLSIQHPEMVVHLLAILVEERVLGVRMQMIQQWAQYYMEVSDDDESINDYNICDHHDELSNCQSEIEKQMAGSLYNIVLY